VSHPSGGAPGEVPTAGASGAARPRPPTPAELVDQIDAAALWEAVPDELDDRARAELPESDPRRPEHAGGPGSSTPAQPDSPGGPAATERSMPTIWEQLGGPLGMIDSGLPVVVFVIVNAIAGLSWGIGAALAAGVLIAGLRLARRRPVTQAIAGLFGVGIAAFIAYRTGTAKGYFLLGIWSYLLYGGALVVSMLVRWPLIGVIWEGINGRGTAWRADKKLVRRYDWATVVWVVVFAARYLVQNYLYDTDQVGWLAVVRLLMGYPMWIAAIGICALIVAGRGAGRNAVASLKDRMPATRRRPDSDPG